MEGLSLARTQKEEFASILNSNNNDINIYKQTRRIFKKIIVGPPGTEPGPIHYECTALTN